MSGFRFSVRTVAPHMSAFRPKADMLPAAPNVRLWLLIDDCCVPRNNSDCRMEFVADCSAAIDVCFGSLTDKPCRPKIHYCPLLSKSGH